MASPISFEKSNQVVLKLQSFHEKKNHAKERVNQFSQFHQSYKPKTRPCLRPILKRFKKVRDYGKHNDDGSAIFRSNSKFEESCGFFRKALDVEDEKVFNLFDREAKDYVKIPPFIDSNRKAGTAKELVSLFNKKVEDSVVASPVLDSDCRKSKVQACVLGSTFRNGLATSFGHKFIQFGMTPSSIRESSCKNDVVQDFIFTIPVSDDRFMKIDSPAPQVFDERSHSIDCDFQLGYHMPISDTRGKVETILVQDDASTGVVLILQFHYHKGIRDKGGGLAKDKIWNDHSRIFRYKISTILISSCTKQSENATAYNKDGTVCLSEFNSMDFLAICELGFVLNAKKRNFLEEADPFIIPAEKTRLALNVFDEIPDSNCLVVVNFDMCYCKGIRDKGGGSKFKYMVSLNIHFSCMNASGDSIECSQDGIFKVVGGEFYSSNIQLSGAGKKKFPNVREDYLVHSFYGQKKLTFGRNVHGSFGLPDTSHLLEGGILTGRRMMTMSDHGILYHLSSKYDEHRKLDVAFTSAMHMPKLDDGSSVFGLLLLTLWRTNLIWEASTTLLPIVEAIFAIPPWIVDEALRFILISIGKTNWIVGNTVLRKTWGLPIERADSCQPIWPLVLIHKFPNNTTSMVVNFVITAVIGALFAKKERKQIHRVGVRVDFLCRCSVHVSSVIMHLDSRCGNEHNALRFFLDPDLCEITKPNISWNSLLAGYFESRGTS